MNKLNHYSDNNVIITFDFNGRILVVHEVFSVFVVRINSKLFKPSSKPLSVDAKTCMSIQIFQKCQTSNQNSFKLLLSKRMNGLFSDFKVCCEFCFNIRLVKNKKPLHYLLRFYTLRDGLQQHSQGISCLLAGLEKKNSSQRINCTRVESYSFIIRTDM